MTGILEPGEISPTSDDPDPTPTPTVTANDTGRPTRTHALVVSHPALRSKHGFQPFVAFLHDQLVHHLGLQGPKTMAKFNGPHILLTLADESVALRLANDEGGLLYGDTPIRCTRLLPSQPQPAPTAPRQALMLGPGFSRDGLPVDLPTLERLAQRMGSVERMREETFTLPTGETIQTGTLLVHFHGHPKLTRFARTTVVDRVSLRLHARAGTWFKCHNCLALRTQPCRCGQQGGPSNREPTPNHQPQEPNRRANTPPASFTSRAATTRPDLDGPTPRYKRPSGAERRKRTKLRENASGDPSNPLLPVSALPTTLGPSPNTPTRQHTPHLVDEGELKGGSSTGPIPSTLTQLDQSTGYLPTDRHHLPSTLTGNTDVARDDQLPDQQVYTQTNPTQLSHSTASSHTPTDTTNPQPPHTCPKT